MARMIGRLCRGFEPRCPRCDVADKATIRAREERQWRSEADDELQEHPDQYWLFL